MLPGDGDAETFVPSVEPESEAHRYQSVTDYRKEASEVHYRDVCVYLFNKYPFTHMVICLKATTLMQDAEGT